MPVYTQDPRNGYGGAHGASQKDNYQPAQPYQQSYTNPSQTQQQSQAPAQPEQRMGDQFQSQHQLRATFYPGGQDDFYMPEVISPLPQRIMPELEQNVEGGLARLELEASQGQQHNPFDTVSSIQSPQISSRHDDLGLPPFPTNPSAQRKQVPPSLPPSLSPAQPKKLDYEDMREDFIRQYNSRNVPESPKFSPFPRPRNPGPAIPLSDDDEEDLLDRMRPAILQSNDPDMQLAWAQDALAWVETASSLALRQQDGGQPARTITPKIEHQLRIDALSIVEFLGEQGHPKAEFMMGMWLEFGKFGHRVDKREAFSKYRRAAEKKYWRAEYRIGMQYEGSNNPAKAIEHYQKGVEQRDSASNYRLGMMTLLGQHGVTQNFQRGIELIRYSARGADKNAPQGAYIYGMLLARDLPNVDVPDQYLPYDTNEARLYIEKAAKLGFAKAQLKMAQAYEMCQLGVDFDPTLSLHYNALASRQGEAEADMNISKWFLCGYEKLFEKNNELAFTYAKRAAGAKLATAEFALGYFYEIGIYVQADLREAEMWYKLASEHGNKDALGRIDSIKKNNTLSKKDHDKMAISRIKSQYGSMRGQRPDRFKEKPPPMPSMAEDLDMPDPRKSYSGTGTERRPTIPQVQLPPVQVRPPVMNQALPPRSVSTAPYPEDDLPRFQTKIPPKKIAPYPLEDIGAGGLRPVQIGPHADRPGSAFGIRPLNDAFAPPGRGRGDPRPATSQSNFQPSGRGRADTRPATSMGNIQPPGRGQMPVGRGQIQDGRGQPAGRGQMPEGRGQFQDGRGQPGGRGQIPEGRGQPGGREQIQDGRGQAPEGRGQPVGRGQMPEGRGQPAGRGEWQSKVPSNFYDSLPSQQTRVGESRLSQRGPYDVDKPQPSRPADHYSGPSGTQRPSSSDGPAQRTAGSQGPGAYHRRSSSGYERPQEQDRFARLEHGSAAAPVNAQSANYQRPPRVDSAQPSAASGSHASNRPMPSQTMSSQSSRPSQAAPSPAPSSGPSTTAGPKKTGQGPATFDEMGIPASKNDKECAVM